MVDPDPCIYCCPIPSGVTSLLDQLETTMDVVPHNDSGRQRKHNQFLMLIEPFRVAALRKRLPELPARIYATHASRVVLISVPLSKRVFRFASWKIWRNLRPLNATSKRNWNTRASDREIIMRASSRPEW